MFCLVVLACSSNTILALLIPNLRAYSLNLFASLVFILPSVPLPLYPLKIIVLKLYLSSNYFTISTIVVSIDPQPKITSLLLILSLVFK